MNRFHFPNLFELAKLTVKEYSEDGGARLAAALAYFGTLAVAPTLLVVSTVTGMILGEAAAQGQLVTVLGNLVSEEVAQLMQQYIAETARPGSATLAATLVGVAIFTGATFAVFNELQNTLNLLWRVRVRPGTVWWKVVLRKLVPFGMVFFTIVALVAAVLVSTVVPAVEAWIQGEVASSLFDYFLSWWLPLLAAVVVFTLLYQVVPDAVMPWRIAITGGLVTGVLFTVGMQLFGLYLARTRLTTFYGIFGVLVALLIWVNYSAQIVLIGGKFTYVLARLTGQHVRPAKYAAPFRRVTDEPAAIEKASPEGEAL